MENPKLSSSSETETETEPESEPAQLYMVYFHYKVAQDPALREKLLRQLLTRCIKIFLSHRDEDVRKYLLVDIEDLTKDVICHFLDKLSSCQMQWAQFLVSEDAVLCTYFLDLIPQPISRQHFSALPTLILTLLKKAISGDINLGPTILPESEPSSAASGWATLTQNYCHTDLYRKMPVPGQSHRFYLLLRNFLDSPSSRPQSTTTTTITTDKKSLSPGKELPGRQVLRKVGRSLLECTLVRLLSVFEKTMNAFGDPDVAVDGFFDLFRFFVEHDNLYHLELLAAKMARTVNRIGLLMAGRKESLDRLHALDVVGTLVRTVRVCIAHSTPPKPSDGGDAGVRSAFVAVSLDITSTLIQILWRASKLGSTLPAAFVRDCSGYKMLFDVFLLVDRAGSLYHKSLLVQHLAQSLFILPAPLLPGFSRSFIPTSSAPGQASLSCPFYTFAAQDMAAVNVVSPPSPGLSLAGASSCRNYASLDTKRATAASSRRSKRRSLVSEALLPSPSLVDLPSKKSPLAMPLVTPPPPPPTKLPSISHSPSLSTSSLSSPYFSSLNKGEGWKIPARQQKQKQQPELVEEVECLRNSDAYKLILECYVHSKSAFVKDRLLRLLKAVFAIKTWVSKVPVAVPLLDPFPIVFGNFDAYGFHERAQLMDLLSSTTYLQNAPPEHLATLCRLLKDTTHLSTVALVARCITDALESGALTKDSLAAAGLFEALATFLADPLQLPHAAALASNPAEVSDACECVKGDDSNNSEEEAKAPEPKPADALYGVSRMALRLLALYAAGNEKALVGLRHASNFQPLYKLLLVPQVRAEALALVAAAADKTYHLEGRVVRGLIGVLYSTGGAAAESADVLALWTNVLDALSMIVRDNPDASAAFRKVGGFTWAVSVVELFNKRKELHVNTDANASSISKESDDESDEKGTPPPDIALVRTFLRSVLHVFCAAIKGSNDSVSYIRSDLTFEALAETFKTCLAVQALPDGALVDMLVTMALRDPRKWPFPCGASDVERAECLRVAVPEFLVIAASDLFALLTPETQRRVVADIERIALSSGENVALLSAANMQGRILASHGDALFARLADTADPTGEALGRLLAKLLAHRTTARHLRAMFTGLAKASFHSRILRLMATVAGAAAPQPPIQPLRELVLSKRSGILGLRGAVGKAGLLSAMGGKVWPPKKFTASVWFRVRTFGSMRPVNASPNSSPSSSLLSSSSSSASSSSSTITSSSAANAYIMDGQDIFSFTAHDCSCVLLKLTVVECSGGQHCLALVVLTGPKPSDTRTFVLDGATFAAEDGWRHVVLSIGNTGDSSNNGNTGGERWRLRRAQPSSRVRLFVDGALVKTLQINFSTGSSLLPSLSESSEFCVGNPSPRRCESEGEKGCEEYGDIRLGCMTFFDECPTDAEVYLMHIAGPDHTILSEGSCEDESNCYCHAVSVPPSSGDMPPYALSFLLSQRLRYLYRGGTCDEEGASDNDGSNEGVPMLKHLSKKVVFLFVPHRLSFVTNPGPGSHDTAMTPVRTSAAADEHNRRRQHRSALTAAAIATVHSPSLCSELGSAGGIPAVLYVLGVVQTKEQQQAGLELLAALLRGSPANCRAMRACDGYVLLAQLMKRPTWTLDADTVVLALELAGVSRSPTPAPSTTPVPMAGSSGEDSSSDLEPCFDRGALVDADATAALLLDWGIWKRAPGIVKELLFRSLTRLVTVSPYASVLNAPLLIRCKTVSSVLEALNDPDTTLGLTRLMMAFCARVLENGCAQQQPRRPDRESINAISSFLLATHKRTRMVAYTIGSSPKHYFSSSSSIAVASVPQRRRHVPPRSSKSYATLISTPLARSSSAARAMSSMSSSTSDLPVADTPAQLDKLFAQETASSEGTTSKPVAITNNTQQQQQADSAPNGHSTPPSPIFVRRRQASRGGSYACLPELGGLENEADALLARKRVLVLEMLLSVLEDMPTSFTQEELTKIFPIEGVLFMLQHPSTEFRSLLIRLIRFCMQAPLAEEPSAPGQQQQQQQQQLQQQQQQQPLQSRFPQPILPIPLPLQQQQQAADALSYAKFAAEYGFELLGTQLQVYTAEGGLFYALFEFMVGKAFPRNATGDIYKSLSAVAAKGEIQLEYPQLVSAILMAASSPSTSYREQREVIRGLCKICASSAASTQALLDSRLLYVVVGLLVSRLEKRQRDGMFSSPVTHSRLDDAFYLAEVPPITPHGASNSTGCLPAFSLSASPVPLSLTPLATETSSPVLSSDKVLSPRCHAPTSVCIAATPSSEFLLGAATDETDEDILRLIRVVVLQGAGTKGLCAKRLCDTVLMTKATLASERLRLAVQCRVIYDVLRQFSSDKDFCFSKRSVRNFAQISVVVAEFIRYGAYFSEEKSSKSDSEDKKDAKEGENESEADKKTKSEEAEGSSCENANNDDQKLICGDEGEEDDEEYSVESSGTDSCQSAAVAGDEWEEYVMGAGGIDEDDLASYLRVERVPLESVLKLLLTLLVMVLKSVDKPAGRDAAAKSISSIMDTTWRVLLYVFEVSPALQPDFVAWALDLACQKAVLASPVLARCVSVMVHISKLHKDPVLGTRARRTYEALKAAATSKSAKVSISLRPSIFRNSNSSRLVDARVLLQRAFGVGGASDALSLPGPWVEDAARWQDEERSLASHFRDAQQRGYEATLRTFEALKVGVKRLREAVPGRVSKFQWLVQTTFEVPRIERAQRQAIAAAAAWKAVFAACSHERGPCPILCVHPPFCRYTLDTTEDSLRQRLRLRWKVSDPTTPTLRPPYAVPELTGVASAPLFPGTDDRVVASGVQFCYRRGGGEGKKEDGERPDSHSLPLARKIFPYFEDGRSGGTTVTIQGDNLTAGVAVYIGGVPARDVRLVSATELTAVTPPQREWGFYEVDVVASGHVRHNTLIKYGYIDASGFSAYMAAKNAVALGRGGGGSNRSTGEYAAALQNLKLGVPESMRKSAAAFFHETMKNARKPLPLQASPQSLDWDGGGNTPQSLRGAYISSGDKIQLVERVTLISMYSDREGEVVLTTKGIAFFSSPSAVSKSGDGSNKDAQKSLSWRYEDIYEIHERRYVLRDVALELFFTTGKTAFLAFSDATRRNRFWNIIHKANLPNLRDFDTEDDLRGGLLTTSLTDRWARGDISNYEYLMRLNVLAGRTFNDLNQYPVFPWVIADYTSETLDLSDPKTFRDLSKPMGALDPARAKHVAAKYEQLEEMGEVPYHYGTHYSSSGAVLHFMSRLEPYASYHVAFQSGRFDVPDRLFYDVAATWTLASSSPMGDVKELIPEFYTLPEMFENRSEFDFGERQDGSRVCNVHLPPWAKGSAREFVRLNRAALECEHVSAHLHEWIDLIFGCKQQSREALNVFHPYTCEGGIDWNAIKDPVDRLAKQTQVNTWGQTPRKLFRKPHPQRNMRLVQQVAAALSFAAPPGTATAHATRISHVPGPVTGIAVPESTSALASATASVTSSIVIPRLASASSAAAVPSPSSTVSAESNSGSSTSSSNNNTSEHSAGNPLGIIAETDPQRAQMLGGEYVTWGHWDGSIRVCSGGDGKVVASAMPLAGTDDEVTVCAAAGPSLFCGTKSGAVLAWRRLSPESSVLAGRFAKLFGHDGPVRALEVSAEHNIAVSGSSDGACVLWDTNKMSYVRTLRHRGPIVAVCMSPVNGNIYTLEADVSRNIQTTLHVWSINGIKENVVAVGKKDGTIDIMKGNSLKHVRTLHDPGTSSSSSSSSPITALRFTCGPNCVAHLYSGNRVGELMEWNLSHIQNSSLATTQTQTQTQTIMSSSSLTSSSSSST